MSSNTDKIWKEKYSAWIDKKIHINELTDCMQKINNLDRKEIENKQRKYLSSKNKSSDHFYSFENLLHYLGDKYDENSLILLKNAFEQWYKSEKESKEEYWKYLKYVMNSLSDKHRAN